jgi:hypothetical protein
LGSADLTNTLVDYTTTPSLSWFLLSFPSSVSF